MATRVKDFRFTPLSLDRSQDLSLQFQLYKEFRKAIISGKFRAGMRLPSTRILATDLGVSRNTVVNAFDQLFAEGYIEGRIGSGTYVTTAIPDEILWRGEERPSTRQTGTSQRLMSRRGAKIASLKNYFPPPDPVPFRHGFPSLREFPLKIWARLTGRRMRDLDRELLNYGHPSGYWRLRKAISSYLAIARSVHCAPEQVIIHAGSQQALYLAAQILLDPGETAWIEDPGYLGARSALIAAGAKLVPVPVDEQGLNVSKGIKRNPNPKLIYVTPSNQYPLTITMTLSRRMELLAHANRSGAWIIEDDYDSEFRYEKHPIAALQGLDKNDRVIYIGTFSKLLVPTLRLGFLVVPPVLVDAFSAAIALISRSSPAVEQAVLADFIEEGHLGRHIRAMRMLYMERQIYFREIARRELDDLIEVRPTNAGTHLIGWLPAGDDDSVASAAAARQGVLTMPLSMYCLKTPARGALILGYASFEKHETAIGIQKLATGLRRQVYG